MKILIINKFLHPNGGSETYIFALGKALRELGHEVQYFGMEHPERIVGNNAESYTANMDFHSHGAKRLLYPFRIIYSREARIKLRKVLLDFQPEVVHLNNFNFQLTPSIIYEVRAFEKKQKYRTKLIYTAHDCQLLCPNHLLRQYIAGENCTRCVNGNPFNCTKYKCIHGSFAKSLLGSLEATLYRFLKTYRLLDVIVCPSRFMKEQLDSHPILAKKTVVLQNFVDIGTDAIHSPVNGLPAETYVLYFGRYSPEKGLATLLKAAKDLPDIPFVFAGSGPLEAEVNALPNGTNKGFLYGGELTDTVNKAQFAVFPSECYENCPLSVMEALALGTPVIAAAMGGVPELVQAGVNGELFESGNADELREKIRALWNDADRIQAYKAACGETHFMTANEYCERLLGLLEQ
jgi:glycosyltransferase involved in cell wall biosynthesis